MQSYTHFWEVSPIEYSGTLLLSRYTKDYAVRNIHLKYPDLVFLGILTFGTPVAEIGSHFYALFLSMIMIRW